MITDITELALLVSKAKASVFTLEYISQFEPADIDSDDVDLRFEVDGRDTGTNVSIVDECGQAAKVIGELVEALEKAQAERDELRLGFIANQEEAHEAIKYATELKEQLSRAYAGREEAFREVDEMQKSLDHTHRRRAIWREKAVTVETEIAALRQRIAELESRTVKLPSLNPEMFNEDVMFGYRKAQKEAVDFCAAAGIKVEAE